MLLRVSLILIDELLSIPYVALSGPKAGTAFSGLAEYPWYLQPERCHRRLSNAGSCLGGGACCLVG